MKTKKAIVYIKDGLWVAETEDGKVHTITEQSPFHSVLTLGRDDNRMALVEVLDCPGGSRACFESFYSPT